MKTVPVLDAKAHLGAYLEECQEQTILITKHGRAKAILIPAPEDEAELERVALAFSPKFWLLTEQAAARIEENGGIAHNEFWKSVEQTKV